MQWGQKRIEWGYSNKSSVSGIGPVEDVNSADITSILFSHQLSKV
jgi:hypothetical protein